ncbi:MAG: hypothetical protein Q9221_008927 [Calogaya cf. arnoldii]
MYRYIIPIMFELDRVATGEEPFTPAFLPRAAVFLKVQFAIIVLFWTIVWIVKVSFLIFYRNLFTNLPDHMVGWRIASGFTAVTAREKIALGAVFMVGLIKIIFAVIRVVRIGPSATHVNPIWLALWSMIEASVAIVVASLPSFKVLFARGRRRRSEIRGAKWSKTFHHWRSHPRHSNDMIEPLESGIALDGMETPAHGDEAHR